jgi:hypothetical protein
MWRAFRDGALGGAIAMLLFSCNPHVPKKPIAIPEVHVRHVFYEDGEGWMDSGEGIAVFTDGTVCDIHKHVPNCTREWVPRPTVRME